MTTQTAQQTPQPDGQMVEGRLVLFGFDPAPAVARVRMRDRAWRVRGAVQIMVLFVIVAPVVALIPPHAPWPIGALGVGTLLARRRLGEKATLLSMESACPKCSAAVTADRTRLREPHSITCEGCHHEARLDLKLDEAS